MKYWVRYILLWGLSWCAEADIHRLVMFGDSLSDNGNLYAYMKHELPISPPYYQGRFTNGPVWIEHLAALCYPQHAEKHLLNYAFGGAGVTEHEAEDDGFESEALFSLDREVDSYLLSHHDRADQDTLFVFWIGSNNYIALPDDPSETVQAVRQGIDKEVARLVQKGARHVMVMNIPDLGQTPAAKDYDAVALLTTLTRDHNRVLRDQIEIWKTQYPEVQWIFFDVNQIFLRAVNDPHTYGFSNTTGTCYEALLDDQQLSSQWALKMASPQSKRFSSLLPSAACDGYLFFDMIHPTVKAHTYIAHEAYRVLREHGLVFSDETMAQG